MRVTLHGHQKRFRLAEERTSELDDWSFEIIQLGERKKIKKN